MDKNFQVSVQSEEEQQHRVTVLRIASAARNSVSQFYSDRVQVSTSALGDLNRKVADKLRLHRIDNVQLTFTIQFENDKSVVFNNPESLKQYDSQIDALTQLVSVKWSFVCDVNGDGVEHLHSIYVRISERLSPGIIMQKVMSRHTEDLESLDNEAFATIMCKVDFIDNRFSGELLSVVTEWVASLPRAESSFGFINWLQRKGNQITAFVYGVLPSVALLGYIGLWVGFVPATYTSTLSIASAWIVGAAVLYLISQYVAITLNTVFMRQVIRISRVPVFKITAGDSNRMKKFAAKAQKSMLKLAMAGLIYGSFKGIGLYFASFIFRGG